MSGVAYDDSLLYQQPQLSQDLTSLNTPDLGNFAMQTPDLIRMLMGPDFSSPAIQESSFDFSKQYISEVDTDVSQCVNPNDVCGGYSEQQPQQQYQQQPQQPQQYQPYQDNGYSSSSSFPNSPDSMFNNGYGEVMMQNISIGAASSPADSHYSADSGASGMKQYTNLDQSSAVLKQEPQDMIFPAVIDEINHPDVMLQQYDTQTAPIQYTTTGATIGTTTEHYATQSQQPQYQNMVQTYSYQEAAFLPTTVSCIQQSQEQQQPQQQMQTEVQQVLFQSQLPAYTNSSFVKEPATSMTMVSPSSSTTVTATTSGRKRNANGAFASTNSNSSSPSSSSNEASIATKPSASKKPRMTKKEKQNQLDRQMEQERIKNKELKEQIELMSRQVLICSQFLQRHVSPIVQQQQRQQGTWILESEPAQVLLSQAH